jgi:hypothetical protein
MVRLMSSLLGKCGISAAADAETRDPFESLLKQARRVFLMQEETDFADRVSRFIVSSQRVQRWQEEQTTTSVVVVAGRKAARARILHHWKGTRIKEWRTCYPSERYTKQLPNALPTEYCGVDTANVDVRTDGTERWAKDSTIYRVIKTDYRCYSTVG